MVHAPLPTSWAIDLAIEGDSYKAPTKRPPLPWSADGCGVCFVKAVTLCVIQAHANGGCVFLKPLGPIPRSSVRWSPRSGHGSGLYWHPTVLRSM